jgi:hypothetical protein
VQAADELKVRQCTAKRQTVSDNAGTKNQVVFDNQNSNKKDPYFSEKYGCVI